MVGELSVKEVVVGQRGESVVEAAQRLRTAHVGDLVVVDDLRTRVPVGVLTDRDLAISAMAMAPDQLPSLTVGDIMTSPAITARDTDSLNTALTTMEDQGVRRLVVIDAAGMLSGVLTVDDILGHVAGIMGRLATLLARESKREAATRP